MRYARICDKENEGVMVLSDAFKMCSWFLMKEYLKTGKNARQQEKYSAGFQVPLSFLRDSTRIREKRARKPEHRHARMSKKAPDPVGVV